jgi:hypothetical protein
MNNKRKMKKKKDKHFVELQAAPCCTGSPELPRVYSPWKERSPVYITAGSLQMAS